MPTADPEKGFLDATVSAARSCSSEDSRPRPKVGATLSRGQDLLGTAHRGELSPGEHAEYTLLQRKLADHDLMGTTLFTTLEPCTTRSHPKRPCAAWIVDRGIGRVVVGMLDPNPVVYERGVSALRAAGISVDYFPAEWRDEVFAENQAFVEQFHASPALQGRASFNFRHNNGFYSIGNGDLMFKTRWSNASSRSIHAYTDRTGLRGLGLALSAKTFSDIRDAGVYDMSSRVQTPSEGDYVVLRNSAGHYAVIRVEDVKARSHGDAYDAVTIQYRINQDGSPYFKE